MNCSIPINAAILADYWLDLLSASDEESLEEHLLECDRCGERLREMIALSETVRDLARTGSLRMIVSDAFLKCSAAQGLQIREYAALNGGSVQCTVNADDDLLIKRFAANLRGAKRVDLYWCDEHGVEQFRLQDIPVDSRANGVAYQESAAFARTAANRKRIARLVTFDDQGRELLLGEYTFNYAH